MGEVLPFPRKPDPEPPGLTEDEMTRLAAMLRGGMPEDEAFEVLACWRRSVGARKGGEVP